MENKITTFPAAHNISAELMVFIMVFHWGYKLRPNTVIISGVTVTFLLIPLSPRVDFEHM